MSHPSTTFQLYGLVVNFILTTLKQGLKAATGVTAPTAGSPQAALDSASGRGPTAILSVFVASLAVLLAHAM